MTRNIYFVFLILSITIIRCSSVKKTIQTPIETTTIPEWAPKKYGYKPAATRLVDLIHTKLDIEPIWENKTLKGNAQLVLKPYFYPIDSFVIDAKGFDIFQVTSSLAGKAFTVSYTYDSLQIHIKTSRTILSSEQLVLQIDYRAKPEYLRTKQGDAITSDKGLYFIQPDSLDTKKPYQIWTQGEPESSSCWFPTIDHPNERCTQELSIVVSKEYKTLSNGLLVQSKNLPDGKRKDTWKMDLPHAPYLFFFAVGDFHIELDRYKDIEVSYYVEPTYAPYAKTIFGNTPQMIDFFSKKLNYPYPWPKHSSIIVRDYVSGAMENTSATVFMDALQKTDREWIDEDWDYIKAHELFHHWFGDLVTCKSWSHLSLNESFANYSEYLWAEHSKGKEEADYHFIKEREQYWDEAQSKREPIIRYEHKDPEDMFDSHSYSKGGCILHMLRKEVGDRAFFTALHIYLKKHAFSAVEIHNLRLVFEEVTGRDLELWFRQWFLSPGHPELKVTLSLDKDSIYQLELVQIQDTDYIPLYETDIYVDIWHAQQRNTYKIPLKNKKHALKLSAQKPDLIVVDTSGYLMADIYTNFDTFEWAKAKYRLYTYNLIHRYYALQILDAEQIPSAELIEFLKEVFADNQWRFRKHAVDKMIKIKDLDTLYTARFLMEKWSMEKNRKVKTTMVKAWTKWNFSEAEPLVKEALKDSSYQLSAAALDFMLQLGKLNKDSLVTVYKKSTQVEMVQVLLKYLHNSKDSTAFDWIRARIFEIRQDQLYTLLQDFGKYLLIVSEKDQIEGTNILGKFALGASDDWIRYAAYQGLSTLSDKEYVQNLRKKVADQEKNLRLKQLYELD